MGGELNLRFEGRDRGVGRKGDVYCDAAVEWSGPGAQLAPLKPEAKIAVVSLIAEAVCEFGGVAVGESDRFAALGGDLQAPQKTVGGGLGGIDELDLVLRVIEGNEVAIGGGEAQGEGGIREDDMVPIFPEGGAGLLAGCARDGILIVVRTHGYHRGPTAWDGRGLAAGDQRESAGVGDSSFRRARAACRTMRERVAGSLLYCSQSRPRSSWT